MALLAFYPDEQEKLYHQIIEVNADPDADIPYQDYGLYKRALAVVYETLRLYPSVIGIPKSVTATHDAIIPCSERGPGGIGTLFIPREALVNIDVQALHYDRKFS